jgi:hypothetical protein
MGPETRIDVQCASIVARNSDGTVSFPFMTAKLTITLSSDVLKALRASKSIRVALETGASRPGAPARAMGPARAGRGGRNGFREGSLPAKLLDWAKGRKGPFRVPEVMKHLKIKRGHASMLIAYASRAGAVRRVGRGAYTTN